MKARRQRHLGFTIVELLIVIVVIGILASTSIVTYNGIQTRAIDAITQSDAVSAAKQLQLLEIQTGNYPADASGLTRSKSTNLTYSRTEDGFELTASADERGTKTYCISSSNPTPSEGSALATPAPQHHASHSTPQLKLSPTTQMTAATHGM